MHFQLQEQKLNQLSGSSNHLTLKMVIKLWLSGWE